MKYILTYNLFEALMVKQVSDKGRGVFAEKKYKAGDIIDIAHVITIPRNEKKYILQTVLNNYVFSWTNDSVALPLNYGCLFNHDDVYWNIYWEPDYSKNIIKFYADRDINVGEELLHNYGWS